MKFLGKNVVQQNRSRIRWERWIESVGPQSRKAKFAVRFVEAAEGFIAGTFPLAPVAWSAVQIANREALNNNSLTDAELVDVIRALRPVWKYGQALHKWAISRGYIVEGQA